MKCQTYQHLRISECMYQGKNASFSFTGFSVNGCQKDMYDKLAQTVLDCMPAYTSFPKVDISSEKEEDLQYFYYCYKRRFYDRTSLKRPIYNVKLDLEAHVVHDENGIPILLVNSYVQGQLKSTKQLLYREAVDNVLRKFTPH